MLRRALDLELQPERVERHDARFGRFAGFVFSAMQPKARHGVAPHLREEHLDGLDALVVQPVDPPRSLRFLDDEPRFLQQAQVTRHRGPADRELVGDLADRPAARTEQLDDRAPVRVAQRLERISSSRVHGTLRYPSRPFAIARMRLFRALCSTSASPSTSITGGT